jgi:hypothetical protein
LFGDIHHAASTFTEAFPDFVVTNDVARFLGSWRRPSKDRAICRFAHSRLEKSGSLLVRLEQYVKPAAQLGIAATSFVKKVRAQVRRQRERGTKNRLLDS